MNRFAMFRVLDFFASVKADNYRFKSNNEDVIAIDRFISAVDVVSMTQSTTSVGDCVVTCISIVYKDNLRERLRKDVDYLNLSKAQLAKVKGLGIKTLYDLCRLTDCEALKKFGKPLTRIIGQHLQAFFSLYFGMPI